MLEYRRLVEKTIHIYPMEYYRAVKRDLWTDKRFLGFIKWEKQSIKESI